MVKISKHLIRVGLRSSRPLLASRLTTLGGKRVMLELLTAAARPPKGTRYERVTIAGLPVEQVRPPRNSSNGTLLYLHGGGYALGSAKGYRGLVANLAAASGMTALIPEYSRAPHTRYPVALEQIVKVYSQLLGDGLDPHTTVIAGDSAGGGLTLALAMTLRDRAIAAPAALGLICPWADLAIDVDQTRPALRDPLILPSMAAEWAPCYVGTADPRSPGISPAYGDMTGLPPIVMQTASDDPISIDAHRIHAAIAATGSGTLDHQVFEHLWHDFHLQVSILPEAREAVTDLGAKLRAHLIKPSATSDIHTDHVKVAAQ
jgi:epsilon-lactone hydrolase